MLSKKKCPILQIFNMHDRFQLQCNGIHRIYYVRVKKCSHKNYDMIIFQRYCKKKYRKILNSEHHTFAILQNSSTSERQRLKIVPGTISTSDIVPGECNFHTIIFLYKTTFPRYCKKKNTTKVQIQDILL